MSDPRDATAADGSETAPPPGPTAIVATIVVPVLDEENYIAACIGSLLDQTRDGQTRDGRVELIVVDGGSTDRTLDIVADMQSRDDCIRVLHNPARIQSAGMNLAAAAAAPDSRVLVRADAHALYPPRFVQDCLDALERTGATSVVVPMRTVGHAGFQRAVAAAQNSALGNGGSAHRSHGASRFVDHGHHAVFDRAFFGAIGGYDATFTHNEDAELDHRARLAGGRIWLCAEAAVTYFPRRDPMRLARQYGAHGRGRARTLLTHNIRPRPRQLAPLGILFAVMAGLLLSPLSLLCAVPLLVYVAACVLWGIGAAIRARDPWLLAMGAAAAIMHLSWAVGFLATCIDRLGRRRTRASGRVTA